MYNIYIHIHIISINTYASTLTSIYAHQVRGAVPVVAAVTHLSAGENSQKSDCY